MGVFEQYAPFVQDFITSTAGNRCGPSRLRGRRHLQHDENVLLCASTASGRTEAALFPILTQLYEDPPVSVGAIYIGPLKALINDQFERLNDLCAQAEIPVWHWHGDVAQSHKARMLKHPSGILQITPESLEALLLHKHSAVGAHFRGPALCGDRRGPLASARRSRRADAVSHRAAFAHGGVNPRRVGLSATIGDPELTGQILSRGRAEAASSRASRRRGAPGACPLEHFYVQGPQAVQTARGPRTEVRASAQEPLVGVEVAGVTEIAALDVRVEDLAATQRGADAAGSAATDGGCALAVAPDGIGGEATGGTGVGGVADAPHVPLAAPSDTAPEFADPGIGYIFEHTRDKKCLVFVNSREECEAVTTTLRQYCEARHEPDRFLIHHGTSPRRIARRPRPP